MSKIRIRNGPYSGREKTLSTDAVNIGRDAEASVQILDRSASRFHAEVFPVGGMFFVRDLDSKNGTYVNDERLTDEELLREGDVIKIGTTELIYESGVALNDDDSSDRISYHDDEAMLSNTLEFKIDDLTDLEDEAEEEAGESRSLQILYQVGRLLVKNSGPHMTATVLDFLIQGLPAEAGILFLRQGDSGKLVPQTVRTADEAANPVICRTIIRRTVTENRAFFTADAQSDERLNRKESVIQKGIRSVICVPLIIGGKSRGVLYVSRGIAAGPFDRSDMELLSACAIQIGLAFDAVEKEKAHRASLYSALLGMVQCLEANGSFAGTGERAANAAGALGRSLELSSQANWNLRVAALLHHIGEINDTDIEDCLGRFADIDELEDVLPIVRTCHERLDGSGPLGISEAEQGIENRIAATATAFAAALRSDPDADAVTIIEGMRQSAAFDSEITERLQSCHLDGSLYQPV